MYEYSLQKRLKNDNFSIICSNCIGGIIYNRLNKQFLSPTINLWFYQEEFIRFVCNFDFYLNCELRFVSGIRDYPVAYLGDVRLFFMHYKNELEARDAWERRKRRINYDNLYIILTDTDGITEDDILNLKKLACQNIAILSNKTYNNIDYVFSIDYSSTKFTDNDKYGIRVFEKQWDFVKWLNQKNLEQTGYRGKK